MRWVGSAMGAVYVYVEVSANGISAAALFLFNMFAMAVIDAYFDRKKTRHMTQMSSDMGDMVKMMKFCGEQLTKAMVINAQLINENNRLRNGEKPAPIQRPCDLN